MKRRFQHSIATTLGSMLVLAVASQAQAHFIWLKSETADGKSQAILFFGEDAQDEAYHLPERLVNTTIWARAASGDRAEVATEQVETDDRIGLVGPVAAAAPFVLETTKQYGIYGGSLLTYYAKHVHAESNDQLASMGPSPKLKLDAVPRAVGDNVELTVLWNGQPQAGAAVSVVAEGESEEYTTDDAGKVILESPAAGLIAVRTNVIDKDAAGSLGDEKYTSGAHYATLTFDWSRGSRVEGRGPEAASRQSAIPPLPEPVSSFGGAVCDGWLYVYSGHTGTEHDHSAANLSQHFRRVRLDGSGGWEELPMETPLQGLALVDHRGKLYRVGGLNARNATTDDDADLHSTADFACFDPATNKWTALAPLPDPRSSHDAVVIGDNLYVVGGWTLAGEGEGEWLVDSLVFDLNDPSAGWQRLPEQSFQRRALAAGQWRGQLVVLGGMDENRDVARGVELFDPASGQWSTGPELPGRGMAGFGLSAWNLGGRLYMSGYRGRLYRINDEGSDWEQVAELESPRFFHRLLPAGDDALIAVGGASRDGHLEDVERIDVSRGSAARSAPKADAAENQRAADSSATSAQASG
jgi:hypothetical protein